MDRKAYYRQNLLKSWADRRNEAHGFGEYDKNLCRYISERVFSGAKILEVAVGNGYPFAHFFQRAGYSVYGIDISFDLIEECRRINPNINCIVGDAEDLPYSNSYFDCTYCFHSPWCIPDINRLINEMLRVTKSSGLITFDILNRHARQEEEGYRRNLAERRIGRSLIRYGKNVAKIILRRGTPVWHFVVHHVPTYPEEIYKHFKEVGTT